MRNLFLISFLFISFPLLAQDFNFSVKVSDVQIQISDRSVFRRLEGDIRNFLNGYKWSQDKIQLNEQIDLYIEIIPSSYDQSTGDFKAAAIIQSRRPVYGTNYNSVIFNFRDENWDFNYRDQQRFDFNEATFNNNLTSLLAFYAYFVMGLDYDSYGLEGGTVYFNKAMQVVNAAQQSGYNGWKAFENTLRTRFNLADNILNERFRPMRTAYYLYHRKAMDQFIKEPLEARKQILKALEEVKRVFKVAPNTVLLLMFFEAKRQEMIDIFKGATDIEKPRVIELLGELDIANASKYEVINQK